MRFLGAIPPLVGRGRVTHTFLPRIALQVSWPPPVYLGH